LGKLKYIDNVKTKRIKGGIMNRQNKRYFLRSSLLSSAKIGLLFGIMGLIITVLGTGGRIEWLLETVDFKSRLTNAGPGLCFALFGMVILYKSIKKEPSNLEVRSVVESSIHNFFNISADVKVRKTSYPVRLRKK
jgi:hypothetical protein